MTQRTQSKDEAERVLRKITRLEREIRGLDKEQITREQLDRIKAAAEHLREIIHAKENRGASRPSARRHDERDESGRYADGPKCEHCGKATGYDYYSVSSCNDTGAGVCLHKDCVDAFVRENPEVREAERKYADHYDEEFRREMGWSNDTREDIEADAAEAEALAEVDHHEEAFNECSCELHFDETCPVHGWE